MDTTQIQGLFDLGGIAAELVYDGPSDECPDCRQAPAAVAA